MANKTFDILNPSDAACVPIGAIAHAYIFGQIILIVQRNNAIDTQNEEHTMHLKKAMRTLGLCPDLQLRILSYFTYERLHRAGVELDALLLVALLIFLAVDNLRYDMLKLR